MGFQHGLFCRYGGHFDFCCFKRHYGMLRGKVLNIIIIIIIIIINNLYSAKIQKFSGASHSMHNIIKNILIKNINKINEKIRK